MAMPEAKIIAVGDIHGCLVKLEVLLSRLPIDWTRDRLVFLGDYIDRGPDSSRVIDLVLELKKNYGERVVCLKGNHEDMFLRYLHGEPDSIWLAVGGNATLKSYPEKDGMPIVPDEHMEFLSGLRLYLETPKYIFVHAGLRPGIPLEEQNEADLLSIRYTFIQSSYDWGKRIIFGHTPFPVPLVEKNKIGIDTGAVYGGRLTALVLPDVEFIFA